MALAPGGIFKSYPEHALITTLKQAVLSLVAWTGILTASPTLNF
jgi:hypothetical protein